jgi:hypothetical protein
MTRGSGVRPSLGAFVRSLGAWLHPVSGFHPHGDDERSLQARVGVASLFCIVTGTVGLVIALIIVLPDPSDRQHGAQFGTPALAAALIVVCLSVFAPMAIFRTKNAATTREVLSNPSAPIRPWRSTTITFDAVLVGGLLAGLYFDAELSLLFFGLALIVRVVFTTRRTLESDPNARFHKLTRAWTSGVTGGVAFLLVAPLAGLVSIQGSIAPLILASVVAMYVGLAFNAGERWVSGERTKWAFAKDAVDTRRLVVAIISAFIAWLVAVVGERFGEIFAGNSVTAGTMAGLGIYVMSWLVLWFVSIQWWTRDATRSLALWAKHQAEVTARLADGSLSPELAARASMPTTGRIAASVFGATKTMVVLDDAHGNVTTHLVAIELYENSPRPEPRDVLIEPSMRMELYPAPDHPNMSSVTVAGWLRTGWFMTRSRRIVNRFTELATAALLSPVLASDEDRLEQAFGSMFDSVNRWPTIAAFEQAFELMQRRADDNPHTDSLIVGVYAIDNFGALEGGRFEQAAIAQVMRMALGHQDFAGNDVFVAYEPPGRVWLALSGGPIIRNGITQLRSLQEHINEHGSVPSARLDVDVHVSVSFGYAAHQVDEFTFSGLSATALSRLGIDQGTRDPFTVDNLLTYEFTPEDITGAPQTPVTAVNVLNLLLADHATTTENPFITRFTPVRQVIDGTTQALMADVGWLRSFGTLDLSDPDAFLALVNRQQKLAAEATRVIVDRLRAVFAEADHLGREALPVVVGLPSTLLHPEAREYSLPNLLTPAMDRRECARTVILFNTVPAGAVQSLRLLIDRGLHVAVTAAAAAAADPADLYGWPRWALVFPQHVIQGPSGLDALTVQQTATAIATRETHLIGVTDGIADPRDLVEHAVLWTIDPTESYGSVRESLGAQARPGI